MQLTLGVLLEGPRLQELDMPEAPAQGICAEAMYVFDLPVLRYHIPLPEAPKGVKLRSMLVKGHRSLDYLDQATACLEYFSKTN